MATSYYLPTPILPYRRGDMRPAEVREALKEAGTAPSADLIETCHRDSDLAALLDARQQVLAALAHLNVTIAEITGQEPGAELTLVAAA